MMRKVDLVPGQCRSKSRRATSPQTGACAQDLPRDRTSRAWSDGAWKPRHESVPFRVNNRKKAGDRAQPGADALPVNLGMKTGNEARHSACGSPGARQTTGRNRTKTGSGGNLSLPHGRSGGLTSNNRACLHKSGSVNPSQSMSASLPKRPNCCVAANGRDVPKADSCTATHAVHGLQ